MAGDAFEFASCGLCRFHVGRECRRRSPHIAADSGAAVWPLVNVADFCGDFRRDPAKPATQRPE